MVNKVVLRDDTYSYTSTCGVDSLTGMYFRKSQIGGDSPLPYREKLYVQKTRYKKIKGSKPPAYTAVLYNKRIPWPSARRKHSEEHDYSMTLDSFINPVISYQYPSDPFPLEGTAFGCFGFFEVPSVTITDDEYNSMLSKLFAKVSGSDFNLGVSLGEGKESLETIANGAKRIALALKGVKKLNYRLVAKALGVQPLKRRNSRNIGHTATSMWLEYRYGWQPIVNDVYQASKTLATILSAVPQKRYKVQKTKRASAQPSLGFWGYESNVREIRKQIVFICKEEPTVVESLGLTDPATVVWNLLPFSFVVDWFLPIGNYLEARNAASALKGTFVTTDYDEHRARGIVSGSLVNIEEGHTALLHTIRLTRTPHGIVSARPPTMIPLKEAVSWKKAVTALALLNNFAGQE